MTGFPNFELVPADGADLSPDEELAALGDPGEFLDTTDDVDESVLPLGRTWARNWDDPASLSGTPVVVSGVQSVIAIADLALRVRRGQHPVLDEDFGMDRPEALIGRTDDAELRAIYLRDVEETLLACHDRITAISNVLFLHDADDEIGYVDVTIEIDGEQEVTLAGVPLA